MRSFPVASSPREVNTPTQAGSAAGAGVPDTPPVAHDPDGGTGDIHELLIAAADEAARLLEADGARVCPADPPTGRLRFPHDAGIRSRRSREWVRSIDLPVGTGMFGLAVERRAVVLTRDYLADAAFDHAPDPDR